MRVALWLLLAFQLLAAAYLLAVLIQVGMNAEDRKGLDLSAGSELLVNALLTIALVVMLWLSRRAFSSRLEQGMRWRALGVLALAIAVSLAFSLSTTLPFPNHISGFGRKIAWAVRVSLGVEPESSEVGWHGKHGPDWFAVIAGLIFGDIARARRPHLPSIGPREGIPLSTG